MMRASSGLAVVLIALVASSGAGRSQEAPPGVETFLTEVQAALEAVGPESYAALVEPLSASVSAFAYAEEIFTPTATRVTVRERDRSALQGALPGEGFRLMVEIFTERGRQARIANWRLDVRLARGEVGRVWRIVDQDRLSSLDGLYRLALDPTRQFTVRNLVLESTDLRLSMSSGSAFVVDTPRGITALVLRGRGEMRFTPQPASERTQIRIFAGTEALLTPFDAAFVRFNPSTFDDRVAAGALVQRSVNGRDLRRAQQIFDDYVRESYTLDLGELTRDPWSLLPVGSDLIAEIDTKRFDTLTYALSSNEAEDVSLFDRRRRRNISTYASPAMLLKRGRFYNEDDLVDFDVLDYRLNVSIDPQREWIEGIATLNLRITAPAVATLTLRLDEALSVRSVSSPDFGRLMHLRVVGQNNVVVNLPATLVRNTEIDLTVIYAGRLPPQSLEREAIAVEQDFQAQEFVEVSIPAEPHFLYSNRTHWYPRSPVNDYATGTLRITLPDGYHCVATGMQAVGSPIRLEASEKTRASTIYVYVASVPVRYLACVISRFVEIEPPERESTAGLGDPSAMGHVSISVQANPKQAGRARTLRDNAEEMLRFYGELMGEAPYPTFTLAVTESQLPGGHSPAYFAVLNQPLPTSPFRWRNDPVSFDNVPYFFLAHEIAHQWWGQGVGWQNYHEQWLSEGISQYFAALYSAHERGNEVFDNLMRQMRSWSLRFADQGPIYLGYRLGHVKAESRVFRALVYNKAALVLHMLRRQIGDDAFFAGLRRFYAEYKYQKAGTDDLRRAMEAESGVVLDQFFEQWIYGSAVPRLRFSSETATGSEDGAEVTLRFQQSGTPFDVPVTVTLVFESGERRDVLVQVSGPLTEHTLPLAGELHEILVNDDNAALAHIDR